MNEIFTTIRNGLIVSCQAEGDSPFNSPDGVTLFARSAVNGGAVAIRTEGVEKTSSIIKAVTVPVIGLVKSYFDDGFVRITGSFKDVEDLAGIGTHIIAIDGTFRKREGFSGPEFIAQAKSRYGCIIMADIATEQEALACAQAGADCISTTLSGYTPETKHSHDGPDFDLLKKLASTLSIPVIAEGRVNTPALASQMMSLGAWSIVVGSAITRPTEITKWFVESIARSTSTR
ncbi:MAG: N-acetylmannosamine-6-phosphate 2-epimerase [Bacteroidota bacterium]